MLADRRLSYPDRDPIDDACKIMLLDTTDGIAILGYAGLGATVGGTQPAEWMSAVLRGRKLPLEQSLSVLTDAMQRQFPQHMLRMSRNNPASRFSDNPHPRSIGMDFGVARRRRMRQEKQGRRFLPSRSPHMRRHLITVIRPLPLSGASIPASRILCCFFSESRTVGVSPSAMATKRPWLVA